MPYLFLILLLITTPALAQEAAPALDSGDTAWMLTATALVLLMTIPGVALFYGGMVRKKNVLGVVMQSFAVTCLITILWVVIGYSLAFSGGNAYIGGLGRAFLSGMTVESMSGTIPESVFMLFQMTFAIITPALITGGIAGLVCFWGASRLKRRLGYDDSLDVFAVHGLGGMVGAVLTGVFAVEAIGGVSGAPWKAIPARSASRSTASP